jgi:histidinol-phosphate aminotransferase
MDFKKLFRPGILETRPYSPGKPIEEVQRELGLKEVVKLASNENPEGPFPAVVEAISRAARDVNRYPDAAAYHLTRALAEHLDVDPRSLILGNGSNEVMDMAIRALVSPGENVIYSQCSFIVYPLTTGVHFGCGRDVPMTTDYRHDLKAMAAAVDARTKLIIVCNPNNPTGTYNSEPEFLDLMAALPERVMVAVDEAYYEYVVAEDYPRTLKLLDRHPNLLILRTFSKVHSLAGLRVGYGVGHPDFIAELQKTREPFNVNSLAQAAALACLEHGAEVAPRVRRNRERLEWLTARLEDLGLTVLPSQTNFVLMLCPDQAGAWTKALLQRGVIVRPMQAWGLGQRAIRISVGLPAENERCVAALQDILQMRQAEASP